MQQAPKIFPCPACGGSVAYTAVACPHCGYRPPGARTGNTINTPAIALGLGGLLVAIGSFLPWITLSSIISVSRSGLDGGGDGMVTLGIGVVLALVAAVNLGGAGVGSGSRLLALLGGFAAVVVAIIDGSDVANRVAGLSSAYAVGSIGMGIYVVGIGGGVAILVAIFSSGRASATA
jgi:hypothetical protein